MSTALVPRTGMVYMLTSPSGKSYIGQTRRPLPDRLSCHLAQTGCPAIHAALKKYGLDQFQVSVLMAGIPAAQLNWFEGFCVALFGTLSPAGYNLGPGGNCAVATSEQSRVTRSLALRAAFSTPEAKASRSVRSRAIYAAPGMRAHRATLSRALWKDPKRRASWIANMRASAGTEAAKAKRRAATAAAWADPVLRAARSAAISASLKARNLRNKESR